MRWQFIQFFNYQLPAALAAGKVKWEVFGFSQIIDLLMKHSVLMFYAQCGLKPQCAIWNRNVLFENRIGATHLKKFCVAVFYQ